MHEIENEDEENARVLKCILNGISHVYLLFPPNFFYLRLFRVSQNIYFVVCVIVGALCSGSHSMPRQQIKKRQHIFGRKVRVSHNSMKMTEKSVKYEIAIEESSRCFVNFQNLLCFKWSDKRNSPDTIEVKVALILFIIHRIASHSHLMCR